jgi:hypothetical protein
MNKPPDNVQLALALNPSSVVVGLDRPAVLAVSDRAT